MTLLLAEIDVLEATGDPSRVEVGGICHDSRRAEPGDLFCCLPGLVDDGHRHAAEAVRRGAVALLVEHPVPDVAAPSVVQAVVGPGHARPAMARASAAFYGRPAQDLVVAGVTGTNGKTTVTHLLAAAVGATGRRCAVIGTLGGARTTPEADDLQRLLGEVRDGRPPGTPAPAVALEVSSHALVQHRVDEVRFDVAVFTNLSRDHLDYHGTMEDYFAAKAELFRPERSALAVVNADDRWGRRLLEETRVPALGVGCHLADQARLGAAGAFFVWRGQPVRLAMTGSINVTNALLAAEAAVALGFDPVEVARGLSAAGPVPGRMEVVAAAGRGGAPATVVVDYAHTPAGLEAVLGEARRLVAPGARVLVVFGCGGERDVGKRPEMGAVAARLADVVVVTSDNPRSEEPGAIIAQVLAGSRTVRAEAGGATAGNAPRRGVVVEADREAAIIWAVEAAEEGDVVVVAGKGHEDYQETAGRKRHLDDREVAAQAVRARWGTAAGSEPLSLSVTPRTQGR